MKAIRWSLYGLFLLLTFFWLMADSFFPQPLTYFSLRVAIVQYSGIISMAAMSVALLLAARPLWFEKRLNGLDKMYRLHKWLGIAGLSAAVIHWWWALGTKWMVGWGWLTRPERKGRGEAPPGLEGFFLEHRHFAEEVGEWIFYAMAVLLILALLKRIPYRFFAKTHKWLAALYLPLVFHSVILTKFNYWKEPVGIVLALLLLAGTFAAFWILFRKTGHSRKAEGKITALAYDAEIDTLLVEVEPEGGWKGHAAGQFAFVTFDKKEGAHPYTIASDWKADSRRLTFMIKALGDHTREIRERLELHAPVSLEGPYGQFLFPEGKKRQIWIGAGIGITPFLARMGQLAANPGHGQEIDFFHPTGALSENMRDRLEKEAKSAHIRLHILISPRDGFLDGGKIRTAVPDWQEAGIWFCGPAAFGTALRKDFRAQGLKPEAFHQELFEMR